MTIIHSFMIFLLSLAIPGRSDLGAENSFELTNYVELSKSLLQGLQKDEDVTPIVQQYAQLDYEQLKKGLPGRAGKLAFWINTYNGFVIYLLKNDPSRFENRGEFFTGKKLKIADIEFSLDDIEHGIIRNSRIKWSLGYFRKLFVPRHIRQLQIKDREPRIHFALNCGAKSCPPVAIYDEERVYEQLDQATRLYLNQVSEIMEGNVVETTPLFSWFRGDFGGIKGIKRMLADYDIIDNPNSYDLKFGDYDWTMSIGNYTEL